jgi:hypothetical protein
VTWTVTRASDRDRHGDRAYGHVTVTTGSPAVTPRVGLAGDSDNSLTVPRGHSGLGHSFGLVQR